VADQDRVTAAMEKLMPAIRKAFNKGVAAHKLSSVLRVEARESALNVRLPEPKWPGPCDDLVEPQGAPETALRLCRALNLPPVGTDRAQVEEAVERFGEDTAAAYFRAVLAKLVAAADRPIPAATTPPTAAQLRTQAKALGLPCRVVAGPTLYSTIKDLRDAYVEKVLLESQWPSQRALVVPLTSKGPWIEELEPEFVLEWAPAGTRAATLEASRRLYLRNAGACYLFEL